MKKERQPDAAGFLPPEVLNEEREPIDASGVREEVRNPQKISDKKPDFKPSSSEVRQPHDLPPTQGGNYKVTLPGEEEPVAAEEEKSEPAPEKKKASSDKKAKVDSKEDAEKEDA